MPSVEFGGWLRICADSARGVAALATERLASDHSTHIVTVNPEIYEICRRDAEYRRVVSRAELRTCDGFGLAVAVRMQTRSRITRVTGVDLCSEFIRLSIAKAIPVFVLGSTTYARTGFEVRARTAGANVIQGQSPVVQDVHEAAGAIESDIPPLSVVLVALGAPKQEFMIEALRRVSHVPRVYVGVGGAIDFLSGTVRRAPRLVRGAGLEWLYRLATDPRGRFSRQFSRLPGFAYREILSYPFRARSRLGR